MILFDYQCSLCKYIVEELRRRDEVEQVKLCPVCGKGKLEKIFSKLNYKESLVSYLERKRGHVTKYPIREPEEKKKWL